METEIFKYHPLRQQIETAALAYSRSLPHWACGATPTAISGISLTGNSLPGYFVGTFYKCIDRDSFQMIGSGGKASDILSKLVQQLPDARNDNVLRLLVALIHNVTYIKSLTLNVYLDRQSIAMYRTTLFFAHHIVKVV